MGSTALSLSERRRSIIRLKVVILWWNSYIMVQLIGSQGAQVSPALMQVPSVTGLLKPPIMSWVPPGRCVALKYDSGLSEGR